jgi:hypothetical protein
METPPSDPKTGKPLQWEDKRAEFERISRQTPRDPKAERAFLENKIELVRTDPRLSEEEKARAIAELKVRLSATEEH